MKRRHWATPLVPLVAVLGLLLALAPRALSRGDKGEDKKVEKGEDKKGEDKKGEQGDAFKPVKIDGKLSADDPKDKKLTDSPAKIHKVKLTEGKTYDIRLSSMDFDTYLRIEDDGGKELAANDDSDGTLNSRLAFTPKKTGTYSVIATSFDTGNGQYLLTINEKGGAGKVAGKKLDLDKKGGATVTDKLAESDPAIPAEVVNKGPLFGNKCKLYTLNLKANNTYVINLDSDDFDAVLLVTNSAQKVLAFNDDANPPSLNAEISFRAPEDGTYTVIATSLDKKLGDFTLKVAAKGEAKAAKIDAKKLQFNKDGGAVVTDKLADGDPGIPEAIVDKGFLKGNKCKLFALELKANNTYVINLDSDDFDAVLILADATNKVVALNDDANGTLNSEITFRAPEGGTYTLVATSLDKKLGDFTLKVASKGEAKGEKGEKGEKKEEKGGKVELRKLQLNKQGGATVTGKLADGDTPNPLGVVNGQLLKGHVSKIFSVELKGDKNYIINLDSDDFDAVLILADGKQKFLDWNDDARPGETLNSEITFRAPEDGTYTIIATTLNPEQRGDFTLKVRIK